MAQQQQNPLSLTQGEVLMILVSREKPNRSRDEIAEAMGMAPGSLSRLYTYSQLPEKVLKKACEVLNVSPALFDPDTSAKSLADRINDLENRVSALEKDKADLERAKTGLEIQNKSLIDTIMNNKN